jgi:hypothetical protein
LFPNLESTVIHKKSMELAIAAGAEPIFSKAGSPNSIDRGCALTKAN